MPDSITDEPMITILLNSFWNQLEESIDYLNKQELLKAMVLMMLTKKQHYAGISQGVYNLLT
jgi:hypothetical protein